MARVVKDAEVRREELLDTALGLFSSAGYERTSVEQITEAVGVAKGTFYHYFESKQDLLGQLVDSFADAALVQLEAALGRVNGGALERLRAFYTLSTQWKIERRDVTLAVSRWLYMEENLPLLHRLLRVWFDRTRPMLLDIIEAGAAEGVFHVDDPGSTTTICLTLTYGLADWLGDLALDFDEHPENAGIVAGAMRAVENAQERILGLPDGALGLRLDQYVGALLETPENAG
jgi:AcrR family transcriptional regulator